MKLLLAITLFITANCYSQNFKTKADALAIQQKGIRSITIVTINYPNNYNSAAVSYDTAIQTYNRRGQLLTHSYCAGLCFVTTYSYNNSGQLINERTCSKRNKTADSVLYKEVAYTYDTSGKKPTATTINGRDKGNTSTYYLTNTGLVNMVTQYTADGTVSGVTINNYIKDSILVYTLDYRYNYTTTTSYTLDKDYRYTAAINKNDNNDRYTRL